MDVEKKENKFAKKSLNAMKLKGGPFGIFKHPLCCKISKKLKRVPFGERKNLEKKSRNAKNKGGPFGIFQHPFCRKASKN